MKLFHLILPLATASLVSCSVISSNTATPLAAGAVARDHGKIGAGEGPAWHNGSLYFTDGGHVNRFDSRTGKTSVFLQECGSANGLYFDPQGRLILCESKARRVTKLEGGERLVMGIDGICRQMFDMNLSGKRTITVLADNFEGRRFNTPNDLTLDSKGRIYFTDPRYGPRDDMEMLEEMGVPCSSGDVRHGKMAVEGVYRIDAPGKVTRILSPPAVDRPNGILVSPNDKYLYICDNNNNTRGGSRKLLRFDLNKDGTVDTKSRKIIFDWKNGRGPDGMKLDSAGRIYVAAGVNKANKFETDEFKAGCYVLSPSGKLITFIPTGPDEATNCAFGGDDFKTLYITSGNHLWSVPLNAPGWKMK